MKKNFILIGVGLGCLFWIIDSIVDVYIFKEGALFDPEPVEIWVRSFVFLLFILFSAYIQSVVSKLRSTEDELRESEGRYKYLFESLQAGILVIDAETHTIDYVNTSASKIIGASPEDIVGKECHKFICPAEKGKCPITDLGQNVDNSERKLLKINGETCPIIKTVTPVIIKDRRFLLESFIDITDRKQYESEINKQKEFIEKAIDSLGYPFYVIDKDYKIVLSNKVAINNGVSVPEYCYKATHNLKEPCKGLHVCPLEEVFRTKKPVIVEHVHYNDSGQEIIVEVHGTPIFDEKGEVLQMIEYAVDITERKRSEEQISHLAYYDNLTGLPNRTLFKELLNKAIGHAHRYERKLAVLFIDLDYFKRINDTLGHNIGDQLLKVVSERLQQMFRNSDSLARSEVKEMAVDISRMGGDEFIVLLQELKEIENAGTAANRLIESFSSPFILDSGHEVVISGSVGIAVYPTDGGDADTLVRKADIAMYSAKDQGRNNYQFYTESLDATALERLVLENELRKALERDEFLLYYQPRIDIQKRKIVGFEALIRWKHKEKGLIPPVQFIPLAEETGLIVPIGEWVLRTACLQNKQWQEAGFEPMIVSVNMSSRQFESKQLMKSVVKALKNARLDPQYLELEITESTIMKNPLSAIRMLHTLKLHGIHVSIDDFGSGYSSLSYLKQIPLDTLKIDRSFVKDIPKDTDDVAIVKAIIAMGHNLQLKVLAEGVETNEQFDFLHKHECDELQGFLFSKPLPHEEIQGLLAKEDIE